MKEQDEERETIVDGNFSELTNSDSTARWQFGDIGAGGTDLTFSSELSSDEFRRGLNELELDFQKKSSTTHVPSFSLIKVFGAALAMAAMIIFSLIWISPQQQDSSLVAKQLLVTDYHFDTPSSVPTADSHQIPLDASRPGDSALGEVIARSILKQGPQRPLASNQGTTEPPLIKPRTTTSQPVNTPTTPIRSQTIPQGTNDDTVKPAAQQTARASLSEQSNKVFHPRYDTISKAKQAYRLGSISKRQYKIIVGELKHEYERQALMLKSRYRAHKLTKREYLERLAALKRRLRGL